MDEKKDPPPEGGEVVSIEDARKRAESKSEAAAPVEPVANALQPIMAAIARELAGLAGPDGVVKLDGMNQDEATKAKTQALLRGLGQGLGDVLAQALGKWADKVDLKFTTAPTADAPKIESPPTAPPGAEDPSKKS
jgi:hypothetical protein